MEPQHTSRGISAHQSYPGSPTIVRAAVDQPTFTFIDHDDDLSSKRIKDINARRAIRSHVMRDVRRRERLAGLKRVSRRRSRAVAQQSSEHTLSRSTLLSPTSSPSLPQLQKSSCGLVNHDSSWTSSSSDSSVMPFPASWLLDPFSTLPGASEIPSMVSRLVFYWKTVFVPTTFPKEHRITGRTETDLMVQSSFTDPGSFFGLMSMCAAHQSILTGRHSELQCPSESSRRSLHDADYYVMKAKCICEMNAKLHDPTRALSNEAFDTIVNLITSALIIGLFDEARMHLKGLKRMVELRGGIADNSNRRSLVLLAILATDVKVASGLMAKPVFPLTWNSQPVPMRVHQLIAPSSVSILSRLGAAFSTNPILSGPLTRILCVVRDIILYSQVSKEDPAALCLEDHDLFRILNCEVEHQLLSYVYPSPRPDMRGVSFPGTTFDPHPMEAITRAASICYLNHFLIVSPPSTGIGRALTKYLKKEISNNLLRLVSKEDYGLMAWALFVGAQGSAGQIEHHWFVERLAGVIMMCRWSSWEQMSDVLIEYLYLPGANETRWKRIWDEAVLFFV